MSDAREKLKLVRVERIDDALTAALAAPANVAAIESWTAPSPGVRLTAGCLDRALKHIRRIHGAAFVIVCRLTGVVSEGRAYHPTLRFAAGTAPR